MQALQHEISRSADSLALLHNRPNQLHRLEGIEFIVLQQGREIVQDG